MLEALCASDSRLIVSACEYQDTLLFFLVGGDKLNILPEPDGIATVCPSAVRERSCRTLTPGGV